MISIRSIAFICALVVFVSHILCQNSTTESPSNQRRTAIRNRLRCGNILTNSIRSCKDTKFPNGLVPAVITDGACCAWNRFSTCADAKWNELSVQLANDNCTSSNVTDTIKRYGNFVLGNLATRCGQRTGRDPCQRSTTNSTN